MTKSISRKIHLPEILAVVVLAAVLQTASCDGGPLFEDTNPDPHPPSLLDLQFTPDSITTGDTIKGSFTYLDSGADIEFLEMRDTGGAGFLSPVPDLPEPAGEELEEEVEETTVFFFPGTTGTVDWKVVLEANQAGPHKIQAWLVDSKNTRSNIVEFTVDVSPPL